MRNDRRRGIVIFATLLLANHRASNRIGEQIGCGVGEPAPNFVFRVFFCLQLPGRRAVRRCLHQPTSYSADKPDIITLPRPNTHSTCANGIRTGQASPACLSRAASGIVVVGNAWQWWQHAAGVYSRGSVPEPGSVLTFRSNGRMRLGHVAVVSRVINSREIEIDHANWWGPGMQGNMANNIPVVDVSEDNDWTAVRVGLGESGRFGSVYPTYGFIYDRPDTGMMVAATGAPAPKPALNPAPTDLRPATERGWETFEEVAEAPAAPIRNQQAVHPGVGPRDRSRSSEDESQGPVGCESDRTARRFAEQRMTARLRTSRTMKAGLAPSGTPG